MAYSVGSLWVRLKRSYERNLPEFQAYRDRLYSDFVFESDPTRLTREIPVFTFHSVEPARFEEQLTYVKDEANQLIGGISYENISALPKSGDLPFPFDPNVPAELQNIYYIGTNVVDINGNDLTINQSFFNINYCYVISK